ncbi:hypothetical protein [Halobacteriovorax sp. JY17]|uniref:hypothetical protein n=1 Tax=Halobacteriovorax sp. JY17 TaxID=2014617 RepID=UPI000C65440A|nr:hypothetical protein [Halobacteriovorax sp. JY17]PIK14866.1 MAG: hypothetical protein CES88_11075 [Halobacteriovorax sp. JY17]
MILNKNLSRVITLSLIVLGFLGIIYSNDLVQNNKETVFLTEQGVLSYLDFKDKFNEKSFVILKKDFKNIVSPNQKEEFKKKSKTLIEGCAGECEVITEEELPSNFSDIIRIEGEHYLGLIIISEQVHIQDILAKVESDRYWGKINQNLHLVGVPYTNKLLNKYSKSIKEKLFPALFAGVFIILLILTKSVKRALFLFFPCLLAASISLSITKFLFNESNLVISIIPLLMFVINFSLVFHIYYTSVEMKSVYRGVLLKKKPILLMVLTTFVGFLSLYFSHLRAISVFGLLSSGLILSSSIMTILWVLTASNSFNILSEEDVPVLVEKNFLGKILSGFLSIKKVVILSITGLVLGSISFKGIRVLTDATEYFPKSSFIKESILEVSTQILGPPVLDIVLKFKNDLTISELKEIEKLENKLLSRMRERNPHYNLLSANLLTRKANEVYTGESRLPDYRLSYLTVFSRVPNSLREGFPLENDYRINILAPPMNVHDYEDLLKDVQVVFKDYDKSFNGLYYHLMIAQKEMIYTLFKSFSISLVVIAFIAFIAFRKVKVFFIFLFVNIIPVFISFVFLKIFGLSFNIATVMTYSISLGLIVDSSFHIIDALDKKHLTDNFFYNTIVKPVSGSSLILTFCFLFFIMNDFLPIREFGICLSIIIFLGMIFDLKVLPTLYLKNRDLL